MARLLVKKTWCHGQLLAAAQGLAYGFWGITGTALSLPARTILLLCALVLPTWTATSWLAMGGRQPWHASFIISFGLALLPLYSAVLLICIGRISSDGTARSAWHMLALVATSLQLFETSAYLVVVACLRDKLSGNVDERRQLV